MFLDLLIGGTSAGVAKTCLAPIELYRIQKQNYFLPNTSLKEVYKKEGVRGLWKGNGVNCIRAFPQYAINLSLFRKLGEKNVFNINNEVLLNFTNGIITGTTSMVIIYPLETCKTYLSLQTNKNKFNNIFDIFKNVRFSQLYGGVKMSVLGFAPWNAISLSSYHYYKKCIWFNNEVTDKLISGGLAGITAISITYPTDLIRRRLQLQNYDALVPNYNGILDCCKKIYKLEGIRGFYRGISGNYLKAFPNGAIQFYTMEFLTKKLKQKN
tara:strand:+ start:5389 stop:6192 length:804 start_codon:yes stop_codon:yes gene_type:complete